MPNAIQKIMEQAKVSRATVYRVLAGSDLVSEELRQRVLGAGANVKTPRKRRRPATTATRLAVWLPGFGDALGYPHHLAVLHDLEKAILERSLQLDIISHRIPEDPEEGVKVLEPYNVRAVLLLNFFAVPQRRRIAERWPTALFFERGHGEPLADLCPDDFTAGYLATQHLLEQGHRRILAAVGGGRRPVGASQRYLGGYALAFSEAGQPVCGEWVSRDQANLLPRLPEGQALPAAEAFLRLHPRPSAVIGRTVTVLATLRRLALEGLAVPADLSLIGYGPRGWEQFEPPGLTKVSYSTRELVEQALDLLTAAQPLRGSWTVPVQLERGTSVRNPGA